MLQSENLSLPAALCRPKEKRHRPVPLYPYDKWEAEQTSQHNKTTRYYYLDNPLTRGEWRIFADLV